jgi:GT2 family glycosyltransferase
MYSMEVFKKIKPPWFEFHLQDPGKPPLGEDIFFCTKLKAAGYKIFVDCDIKVGHLATLPITEESYWAYKFARD